MERKKDDLQRKAIQSALLRFRTLPGLLTALYYIIPGMMSLLIAIRLGDLMPVRIMALVVWGAYMVVAFVVIYKVLEIISRQSPADEAVYDEFWNLHVTLAQIFVGLAIATVACR